MLRPVLEVSEYILKKRSIFMRYWSFWAENYKPYEANIVKYKHLITFYTINTESHLLFTLLDVKRSLS